MAKDYCSYFPEIFKGIEIGNSCCKQHDNDVGERGGFSLITPHTTFFKCLRRKGISLKWCIIITLGGAIMSWIKYPYFVYKKIQYRNKA